MLDSTKSRDGDDLKAYIHYVKRIRSFSGPYFLAFGLNTDQKNSEYGHFSRSDNHWT